MLFLNIELKKVNNAISIKSGKATAIKTVNEMTLKANNTITIT